jgi:hypothetical protein
MVVIFQDVALHILGSIGEGMSIWFIGSIVQGFNHCILCKDSLGLLKGGRHNQKFQFSSDSWLSVDNKSFADWKSV